MKPQANAIVVNDLDRTLPDEVLNQLAVEDELQEQFLQLSINAISSSDTHNCLKLKARIKDKVMLILVDSGSSHSFVSSQFVRLADLSTQAMPVKKVQLANGEGLQTDQIIPDLKWYCQGHTLTSNMIVLEMQPYDAILGYDWLKVHNPMTCDWESRTMSFQQHGHSVTLQGLKPNSGTLQSISAHKVYNLVKGNDIWACVLMDFVPNQVSTVQPAVQVPPAEITALLSQFEDVFQDPKQVPPQRSYDHAISLLPGPVPINCKPYHYSPEHKSVIEKQVQELLQSGLIVHSHSPFASPVLLVRKKDGSWRFCVDYRKLNAMTIKNRFPMPIIEEILDELHGATVFTKLDMRAGYHQIRMLPEDEHKTAFKTHQGHYHFKVMPFGLTNAPATFQCVMNQILHPFFRQFVLVFLDDILIYSKNWADHVHHLSQVLEVLRTHKLYLKPSKCSFAQDSLEYLGHIISSKGVATDPGKIQAMLHWPVPTSHTEVRAFLGLTGYYRRFVKGYGLLAKPLTLVLRQKTFSWTSAAQQAFDELKMAMTRTPVLALPSFTQHFTVETDACQDGIGAVLMQEGQPVAF